MEGRPTGTVTFLFSDIEGSTRLVQQLGDGYSAVLEEHRELLRTAFAAHAGEEVGTEGDSFFVAFDRASDALAAALAGQVALAAHEWAPDVEVKVRMGVHTGEAEVGREGYIGIAVHEAQRISTAAHGGQVLVSDVSRAVAGNDLPMAATLRDLGHHRLRDLEDPQHLFQLCHPELPSDFPPPRSVADRPHNLPVQLTSFVGRDAELAEVVKLLPECRLLTLTGSGGCGKSRLALEVASAAMDGFPDGAWVAELGPISDPSLVGEAIAAAVGIRKDPDRTPAESLVAGLRDRTLLLLLDNCEHLLGAAATLTVDLLRACPGLRVLATSREPLGVPGETAWRVPSLTVPPPEPAGGRKSVDLTAAEIAACGAIRLFVDRAAAADPSFVLTDANAPAVAAICRRLDGIPLAIELAAARCNVLTVEEIAARLGDRFRLLTGGARTSVARQQTLKATVDWSHDLLADDERLLFRRLGVFSGGFTLDAAERVCADDTVDAIDVLDQLSALVAKSLVLSERQGPAGRYRLLETIRQYALEKLLAAGEGTALRSRHRDWFLDVAERAEVELLGPNQAACLQRLEAELDNLRSALEWSLAEPGDLGGLRIVGALRRFWVLRGHLQEGRTWCAAVLEHAADAPLLLRAKVLEVDARLAALEFDAAEARALGEEALALRRHEGDEAGVAAILCDLADVAFRQGDLAASRVQAEEAAAVGRRLRDARITAAALIVLSNLAMTQTSVAEARTLAEESLQVARSAGDTTSVASALDRLGVLAQRSGDHAAARAYFEEFLALEEALGSRHRATSAMARLAHLAFRRGDHEVARASVEEALALARSTGDDRSARYCLGQLGHLALLSHDYGEARSHLDDAIALARAADDTSVLGTTLWSRGLLAHAEGHLVEARVHLRDSIEVARRAELPMAAANSLCSLADLERSAGDVTAARVHLQEALTIAQECQFPAVEAIALRGIGELALSVGDVDGAEAPLQEALDRAARLSDRYGGLEALESLARVTLRRGDPERAATLLGAADAIVRSTGWVRMSWDGPAHDQLVDELRAALGDERFEKLHAEGALLSFRQAADLVSG